MPTWEEHEAFVRRMTPDTGDIYARYGVWDLIEVDGEIVGSVYLSQRNEIGVSIFASKRRMGYGSQAVMKVIEEIGAPLLANINPANEASRRMWEKLGFKKLQETYALEN